MTPTKPDAGPVPGAAKPGSTLLSIGIDVGTDRLHCVGLDGESRIVETAVFRASEIGDLSRWLAGSDATVAIDAPAQMSTAPHRDDPLLKPKFALGRCAEIALGRDHAIWVPWVAPIDRPSTGWMATGLAVFDELHSRGVETIEVYPYAGYRVLVRPDPLPKKTTVGGVLVRIEAG